MKLYCIRDFDKIFENHKTKILKALAWIQLPVKLNGTGYVYLMSLESEKGPAVFGCFIALLELAATSKRRGQLWRTPDSPHTPATMAAMIRQPLHVVEETLRLCSSSDCDWIEAVEFQTNKNQTHGGQAPESAGKSPGKTQMSGVSAAAQCDNPAESGGNPAEIGRIDYITEQKIREHTLLNSLNTQERASTVPNQEQERALSSSQKPEEKIEDIIIRERTTEAMKVMGFDDQSITGLSKKYPWTYLDAKMRLVKARMEAGIVEYPRSYFLNAVQKNWTDEAEERLVKEKARNIAEKEKSRQRYNAIMAKLEKGRFIDQDEYNALPRPVRESLNYDDDFYAKNQKWRYFDPSAAGRASAASQPETGTEGPENTETDTEKGEG